MNSVGTRVYIHRSAGLAGVGTRLLFTANAINPIGGTEECLN